MKNIFDKNEFRKEKNCIFALSSEKTSILILSSVAFLFLFATNTALVAANYRLSIFNGCCTERSGIVFSEMKRGSLSSFSSFNYKNFSFMEKTMKNYSGANDSNAAVTSYHETVQGQSCETKNQQVAINATTQQAELITVMPKEFVNEKNNKRLKELRKQPQEIVVEKSNCPISTKPLKFLQQLREMRQYYENHKYYEEYEKGCFAYDTLDNLTDALDSLVIEIGELISIELKNNLYYYDTNLKEFGGIA